MVDLIYLRFKHQKKTVFLWCDPTEPARLAKERLAKLLDKPIEDIKLFAHDKVTLVKDDVSFGDAKIENDTILYWVERKEGNKFEEIQDSSVHGSED